MAEHQSIPNQANVQTVTKAMNRILQWDFTRDIAAQERRSPSGAVFHYTTAEGLWGIIEKAEVWATSAYFLNDSSEINYGYGLLKEVLEDWIASRHLPEDSLSLGLARGLLRGFGHDLLNRNIIHPIHLACFCEDDNLLSQWRSYGQAGGYSLGLKVPSEGTTSGIKPEPCVYTARWVKVEYDRNKQADRCRVLLDFLVPIFDELELVNAIRGLDAFSPLGYQGIFTALSEILLEEIMGFKNKAFEVEKEWRIVVRQRQFLKQGTDDGGRTPMAIHFRSLRGLLTPYIKLIPDVSGNKLPLVGIRCGPTRDKTTAGMAVRMLLDNHGYTEVRVDGSDIPVIFSP